MAIYAIGDLHGCYREFKKLLEKINFDRSFLAFSEEKN